MPTQIVDKGWKRYVANTVACNNCATKVGYPAEAKVNLLKRGKKGVEHGRSKTMADLVQIVAVHEFGAPKRGVPQRQFVRNTYDDQREALQRMSNKELLLIAEGKSTPQQSLSRMGEFLTGKIKRKIKEGPFTPLKPATIAAKGSSKPLIDTAQMLQSVTHIEVIHGLAQ